MTTISRVTVLIAIIARGEHRTDSGSKVFERSVRTNNSLMAKTSTAKSFRENYANVMAQQHIVDPA
jgi:hypothetical protein